jgi:cell division protein FtsN
MRIDYNEPKKSYTSTPPQPGSSRTRKESSSPLLLAIIITGVVSLTVGFGSGWVLSQRYAKKGFKAAMEQQSLENTPPASTVQPAATKPPAPAPAPVAAPSTAQPNQPGTLPQTAVTGVQPSAEPPLSFYKTLPSGQKSNVLGSGINPADDKAAKQPLQAAIPSNLNKTPQPQSSANTPKPPAPAAPEKQPGKQEAAGFTVQVASYSLRSEAESLKSKLAGKGYNVHISESNLADKGTWYRVRVGKKLDQEAAKELASKLGRGAIPIPEKD